MISLSKYSKYVFSTPTWIPEAENVAAYDVPKEKKKGMTKTHCWITPQRLEGCKMQLFTIGFHDKPHPNPFMKAHSHPEDEILFFMGTNAENPSELGGVAGVYLGEEKERIEFNTTTAIYVPPNLLHHPFVDKVEKPLFLVAVPSMRLEPTVVEDK